jgi:hypothetical protein
MCGACHTVRRCDGLKEEEREEAHRRAVRRCWEMGGIGVAACRYKGVGVVHCGADGMVRGAALHACLAKAGSHTVQRGEASPHSCDYEGAWPKAGVRTCAVQVCACVYMWLLAVALVVKGQREA